MGTMMTDVPTLLKQYGVDAVISDKDYAPKTGVPAGSRGSSTCSAAATR